MEFKEFYDNLTQEDWMKIIDTSTREQLEQLRRAKESNELLDNKENGHD